MSSCVDYDWTMFMPRTHPCCTLSLQFSVCFRRVGVQRKVVGDEGDRPPVTCGCDTRADISSPRFV